LILKDQQHPQQEEIVDRYIEVHRKVWSKIHRGPR
jgi:hypothetical protein